MANVLIENQTMTDIANAIREKNGSTDIYKPSEMPQAIKNLKGDSIVNLLKESIENNEISGGYFSAGYGQQPVVKNSTNPHYHFNNYFELEVGEVYTIEVPHNMVWSIIFLDNNFSLRCSTAMEANNKFDFVAVTKYITINIKYIPSIAYESYMSQMKLYKNDNLKATEINLSNILDDIDNWTHFNINYKDGQTFENALSNGTNGSYIRYNKLIPISKKKIIQVYNMSSYNEINIQEYQNVSGAYLARGNWGKTSNNILNMSFYYDCIALTPKTGSSSVIQEVLEDYKQWLKLYQIDSI